MKPGVGVRLGLVVSTGLLPLVAACSGSAPPAPRTTANNQGPAPAPHVVRPVGLADCTNRYPSDSPEAVRWAGVALRGADLPAGSADFVGRSTEVTGFSRRCIDASGVGHQVLPCPGPNGWPAGWAREASAEVLAGWGVESLRTSRLIASSSEDSTPRTVTQVWLDRDQPDPAGSAGAGRWLARCGAVTPETIVRPATLVRADEGNATGYYVFSSGNWTVRDQRSLVEHSGSRLPD